MDLEKFISTAIVQIVRATVSAQKEVADVGAWVNPAVVSAASGSTVVKDESGLEHHVREIQFDVAITAGDEQTAGAGAGITVLGLKLGADGKVAYENSTVSRVQFSIPVALPASQPKRELQNRRELDDMARRPLTYSNDYP